jgi:hypothetical protein
MKFFLKESDMVYRMTLWSIETVHREVENEEQMMQMVEKKRNNHCLDWSFLLCRYCLQISENLDKACISGGQIFISPCLL